MAKGFDLSRVGCYQVALQCRAAPGLGCGSRAKPVLAELAKNPAVVEVWIKRDGTAIAVAWKALFPLNLRPLLIRSVLAAHRLKPLEITGQSRAEMLERFPAEDEWYRSEEVDQLSEEEAKVIAKRLVGRLNAKVRLSSDMAETLTAAFAQVCRNELIHYAPEPEQARADRLAREILRVGRLHLSVSSLTALQEAVALGHRPLAGEG